MKLQHYIQLFCVWIFLFASPTLWGRITHATSSGNWNNSGTWSNGVPQCGDTIIIDSNITVNVNVQVNLDEAASCSTRIFVDIKGTLDFNNGKKMYLSCNSNVFVEDGGSLKQGGGGGSSNLIDICQTTVWTSGDGNQTGPVPVGPALPVELIAFKATSVGDIARLDWETSSEINNDFFTVERSPDLHTFSEVMRVPGSGNSREHRSYFALDESPLPGTSYYRLKQTDFNGAFTYSQPVAVSVTSQGRDWRIFPTAVSNSIVNIDVPGPCPELVIHLFTPDGKLIFSKLYSNVKEGIISLDITPVSYYGFAVMTVGNGREELKEKLFIHAQ